MKSISTALTALFTSTNAFYKADLYTLTLADGTIIRTTDADIALTANGFTFPSCAPAMSRTKVKTVVGVEVDSMTVTVLPGSADTVAGLAWQAATRSGVLDGAQLLVETAYLTTWPAVIGTIHVFSGLLSDAMPSRSTVTLTVKSALELLTQSFPRNVYQAVCLHSLYDSGCAVSRAAYTVTSAVVASPAPTAVSLKASTGQAAGYYEQGVLLITSGVNAGLRRTVKTYDPATGFTFALPLPAPPVAGDTILVYPGCDKTLATCRGKFANAGRFRGAPWIPTPETVR